MRTRLAGILRGMDAVVPSPQRWGAVDIAAESQYMTYSSKTKIASQAVKASRCPSPKRLCDTNHVPSGTSGAECADALHTGGVEAA